MPRSSRPPDRGTTLFESRFRPVAEVEEWQERFLLGAENALRSRPKDEEAVKDARIKQLKQKVGDLALDLDIMKEAMQGHPFGRKMLDEFEQR